MSIIENLKETLALEIEDKATLDKEIEQRDANKSKAKRTIVEKIKRFFYLHMYKKYVSVGYDEDYKEVVTNEISSLEEKKEDVKVKTIEQTLKTTSAYVPRFVTGAIEKAGDFKINRIDEKIDKYKEELASEMENGTQESLENLAIASELEKATEAIGKSVEAISQEEKATVNTETIAPEEAPKQVESEEAPKQVEPDQQQIEQNKRDEDINRIKNQAITNFEQTISETINKVQEADRIYYEGIFKRSADLFKKETKKVMLEKIEAVKEKNQIANERDQYKSHYEQTTQVVEQQRQQLADKDTTIAGLNDTITLKDKEISVKENTNEELRSQNEKLMEENERLKSALTNLLPSLSSASVEEEMSKTK